MARVTVIDPTTATGETKQLLDAVQTGLGMVPNFIRVLANSPAALGAFLGLHGIAGAGALDSQTRERIALAVAEQNACQYCVSAHTAIGRGRAS
jgi:AhpD family alkylhydroperoxidase